MNRMILSAVCVALLAGCSMGEHAAGVAQWMTDPFTGVSAKQDIADAFDTEDPDRRREGIIALSSRRGGLGEPYLKAYAALAEDPDPLVRGTAIGTLGRAGDSKYLGIVLVALSDTDLGVRLDAAEALDTLHGANAVDALRKRATTDPEADIRTRSVRALRHYPQTPVLETLLLALDDENYGVRYTARQTLTELTGRDAAYDRAKWRRMLREADDPFAPPPEPKRSWWRVW